MAASAATGGDAGGRRGEHPCESHDNARRHVRLSVARSRRKIPGRWKRELYEIAPSLGISPEERDRIEKAGQGEGLLVTTGRRVWVNLYGHTSPGEFAMANTDVVMSTDVDEGENSSLYPGRNGHAATTAAYAARR